MVVKLGRRQIEVLSKAIASANGYEPKYAFELSLCEVLVQRGYLARKFLQTRFVITQDGLNNYNYQTKGDVSGYKFTTDASTSVR